MRIAKGLAGDRKFCVIDTEAGRANFYADYFQFDRGDLRAPFNPQSYAAAIMAADAKNYPVIVVDSASHEWAGDGGILDMQEDELERMAGDNWQKREAVKMSSWIKPKSLHKAFLQKLLQVRAHVILCFRAEQKIEMVKEGGKMIVREKQSPTGLDGWIPICEKNLPFELTASFLLLATAPGVPHAIKLPKQLQPFFPDGQVISEASGISLGEWASGKTAISKTTKTDTKPAASADVPHADELRAMYIQHVKDTIRDATDPQDLLTWWNSDEQRKQRRQHQLTQTQADEFKALVLARVDALKATAARPAANLNNDMPAAGDLFGKKDQP